MRFASAISVSSDGSRALNSIVEKLAAQLPQIDLAIVFFTPPFMEFLERQPDFFVRRLNARAVIGCTAESVIGDGREYEAEPAIVAWAASLPGCTVRTMHLQHQRQADGKVFAGWPSESAGAWEEGTVVIALAEPLTFPADQWVAQMNEDRPGVPILGGLASWSLGNNQLLIDDQLVDHGAAVLMLSGPVRAIVAVSQGCRPIGEPLVVTRAEANEIQQVRGQNVLDYLQELYQTLPTREQRLVREGLQIGRVISEYQDHRDYGDYLIRAVLEADPERQSIRIGDFVRPGQTIQFHIRDHSTADYDLRQCLAAAQRYLVPGSPVGGLLFTCNGRGTHLFPAPDHDAELIQRGLGPMPLAGFFAAGEFGPINDQNFVHGYTASLVVFAENLNDEADE